MPAGIEGLPVLIQRTEVVQMVQAAAQNAERATQATAAERSLDHARALETQVQDRPPVEMDGFQQGSGGGAEYTPTRQPRPEGEEEELASPATPDPKGRGSVLDVQA